MPKHEFYADPTLFDQWQGAAGHWLCARSDKVCPFAWVLAFTVLGAALLSISVVLLGISWQNTIANGTPAWNQSLARGVTSVAALATAQWLFRQALDVWPRDVALPEIVRAAARYVGWRPRGGSKTPIINALKRTEKASPADRAAVQAFFAGVRAAGCNVSIAKALFAAGIRTPRQLLAAGDDELVAIRGVGPATVRKLRAQFG